MSELVTVAIPAHNEAGLISRTIRSIDAQEFCGDFAYNVTVVANGCTDNTANLARATIEELKARDGLHFQVIELSKPSKVRALNTILGRCDTNTLVCVDADVVFSPTAFDLVVGALKDTQLTVTGAVPKLQIPPCQKDTPIGDINRAWQLYEEVSGIRRAPIGRMLAFRPAEFGEEIPKGVIAEDRFITLSMSRRFGRQSVTTVDGSTVYAIPPGSVNDLLQQMIRHAAAAEQLRKLYPHLEAVRQEAMYHNQSTMPPREQADALVRQKLSEEGIDPTAIDQHHALFDQAQAMGRAALEAMPPNGQWTPILSTKYLAEDSN